MKSPDFSPTTVMRTCFPTRSHRQHWELRNAALAFKSSNTQDENTKIIRQPNALRNFHEKIILTKIKKKSQLQATHTEHVEVFSYSALSCVFSTIIPVETKLGQPLNSLIPAARARFFEVYEQTRIQLHNFNTRSFARWGIYWRRSGADGITSRRGVKVYGFAFLKQLHWNDKSSDRKIVKRLQSAAPDAVLAQRISASASSSYASLARANGFSLFSTPLSAMQLPISFPLSRFS